MKDIVRILERICAGNAITYHYGKKAVLNLLDGSAEADKIYFLHEYTNRRSEYNSSGTKITATNHEGKFFLVKHSDYSQQYFSDEENAEPSKYVTNIEPLLRVFTDIGNSLACTEAAISQWDNIDVTDVLDANMDGLLCTYRVRIPIGHE